MALNSGINSMRHREIHDPEQYEDKVAVVVGVGTIGSHLAHILARMQVKMVMYDHDTVEEHNLATQSYGHGDIGKSKVGAVLEQIKKIQSKHKHVGKKEVFTGKKIEGDVVVSCVDSLNIRQALARMMIATNPTVPIIDGRVGREQVEVYFFKTAGEWLRQLPDEGDDDPCGARFTAYTAYVAAGLIANSVKRLFMGQHVQPRIIYDAASSTFIKE